MSRVGRCIDNGSMEGFWGILKRECYYGHTFTSREQLISFGETANKILYYFYCLLDRVHLRNKRFLQVR